MLYENKKTKEIVELLHSDNLMCVYVVSVNEFDSQGDGTIGEGIVFKGTKKEFKKSFKKANKKTYLSYNELDDEAKGEVYAITLGDRYGILNHTKDYVDGNIKNQDKEWKKFHEEQTQEEREKMLNELAD